MYRLKFSYNWNNKLDCHALTTIRVFNPMVHFIGNKVEIVLEKKDGEEIKGTGTIKAVNRFLLENMSPFVAYIDTGYSVEECKKIIHRMYKHIDFSTYKMALILVVKDKPAKDDSKSGT